MILVGNTICGLKVSWVINDKLTARGDTETHRGGDTETHRGGHKNTQGRKNKRRNARIK